MVPTCIIPIITCITCIIPIILVQLLVFKWKMPRTIDLKQEDTMNFNKPLKFLDLNTLFRSKKLCHSGNLPKLQLQRLKSTSMLTKKKFATGFWGRKELCCVCQKERSKHMCARYWWFCWHFLAFGTPLKSLQNEGKLGGKFSFLILSPESTSYQEVW